MTRTFGPAYAKALDGPRLKTQMIKILESTLDAGWSTLAEVAALTHYPEASISAQLRHLRKPQFGEYQVEKRRRMVQLSSGEWEPGGTWEYRVLPPAPKQPAETQLSMFGRSQREARP